MEIKMYETPAQSMHRYIETIRRLDSAQFTPFDNREELLDGMLLFIEPFLINPKRHRNTLRLFLEGYNYFIFALIRVYLKNELEKSRNISLFVLKHILRVAFRKQNKFVDKMTELFISGYLPEIESAKDEILRDLDPGELSVDILPARSLEMTDVGRDTSLLILQTNVAIYPNADLLPESISVIMSVREDEVQFKDVDPSNHSEISGSYEISVSEHGKLTRGLKSSTKSSLFANSHVINLRADTTSENSEDVELGRSREIREIKETIMPLVISSALGKSARWELLRTPSRPIEGGFCFYATAFVPKKLNHITVQCRVRADLENFGLQEAAKERVLVLSEQEPD